MYVLRANIILFSVILLLQSVALAQKPEARKLQDEGCSRLNKNDYDGARELFLKAIETDSANSHLFYYDIACTYSREEKSEEALKWLKEAFENGYNHYTHALYRDTDLEPIRGLPEFKETIFKAIAEQRQKYLAEIEKHALSTEDYYFKIALTYAVQNNVENGLRYLQKAYEGEFSNSGKPSDTLQIKLKHTMPYFDKFLIRINGSGWENRGDSFVWVLRKGLNTIEAKAVSLYGIEGRISKIVLKNNL